MTNQLPKPFAAQNISTFFKSPSNILRILLLNVILSLLIPASLQMPLNQVCLKKMFLFKCNCNITEISVKISNFIFYLNFFLVNDFYQYF